MQDKSPPSQYSLDDVPEGVPQQQTRMFPITLSQTCITLNIFLQYKIHRLVQSTSF